MNDAELEAGKAVVGLMETTFEIGMKVGMFKPETIQKMREQIEEVEALGYGPLVTGFMIGAALADNVDQDAKEAVLAFNLLLEKDKA